MDLCIVLIQKDHNSNKYYLTYTSISDAVQSLVSYYLKEGNLYSDKSISTQEFIVNTSSIDNIYEYYSSFKSFRVFFSYDSLLKEKSKSWVKSEFFKVEDLNEK